MMEQFEQDMRMKQKPKNNFWKGALCGALAMLVVCLIIGGTILLSSLINRSLIGGDDE